MVSTGGGSALARASQASKCTRSSTDRRLGRSAKMRRWVAECLLVRRELCFPSEDGIDDTQPAFQSCVTGPGEVEARVPQCMQCDDVSQVVVERGVLLGAGHEVAAAVRFGVAGHGGGSVGVGVGNALCP